MSPHFQWVSRVRLPTRWLAVDCGDRNRRFNDTKSASGVFLSLSYPSYGRLSFPPVDCTTCPAVRGTYGIDEPL